MNGKGSTVAMIWIVMGVVWVAATGDIFPAILGSAVFVVLPICLSIEWAGRR